MNDPATPEAAAPPIDRRTEGSAQLTPVAPYAESPTQQNLDAIECKLQAIEAEAEKWMGAKAVWIKKHVADLRNLL